jgi:hypothetical protein
MRGNLASLNENSWLFWMIMNGQIDDTDEANK